jgi:integrase
MTNPRRKKILILDHLQTYIEARDLSPEYTRMLRHHVRVFCEWLGGSPTLDKFESKTFNKWVTELRATDAALNTVDNYRRAVLCVWRDAYEDELIDNPPLRIKRLKKPRIVVECFTHEEIAKLLAEAAKIKGYMPNGVRRSDLMRAAIISAYCTGLRRGDLLRLKRSQLNKDGIATVIQRKTGYPVRVKLSPEAIEACAKLKPDNGDDCLLPLAHGSNWLQVTFGKIVKRSGVRPGQFRWLRRSAGSYAEANTPGGGSRVLGHRDGRVFTKHYEDLSISQQHIVEVPSLPLPQVATA